MKQEMALPLVDALAYEVDQLDHQLHHLADEIDPLMERPELDGMAYQLAKSYGALSITQDRLAILLRQLRRVVETNITD